MNIPVNVMREVCHPCCAVCARCVTRAVLWCCRYNIFTGCPQAKTCTLILRGGAEQFIEETERSLHDAIMIVRRALKNDSVVAGKCHGDPLLIETF